MKDLYLIAVIAGEQVALPARPDRQRRQGPRIGAGAIGRAVHRRSVRIAQPRADADRLPVFRDRRARRSGSRPARDRGQHRRLFLWPAGRRGDRRHPDPVAGAAPLPGQLPAAGARSATALLDIEGRHYLLIDPEYWSIPPLAAPPEAP